MESLRIEFVSASSTRCSEGKGIVRSCIKSGWRIAGGDLGGAWFARCSRALFVEVQSSRSKIRCLRPLRAAANINLFWRLLAPAALGRHGPARTNSIERTLSSALMRSAVARAVLRMLTHLFFMPSSGRRHFSTRPPFGNLVLFEEDLATDFGFRWRTRSLHQRESVLGEIPSLDASCSALT
jgi:hypothetical protein